MPHSSCRARRIVNASSKRAAETAARHVVYYSRNGLAVGDGAGTDKWLETVAGEHEPDVIVIDTVTAASAVADVNDNGAVTQLYSLLRSLAERHNCVVLLLHHERKTQHDQSRDPGQAMMGARQWAGQADAHIAVRRRATADVAESSGERRLGLSVSVPKLRNGATPNRRTFALVTHDDDGSLAGAYIEQVEADESRHDDVAARIVAALDIEQLRS